MVTPCVTADLAAVATVRHCPAKGYPAGVLGLLDEAPANAPVLLAGDMENHVEVVEAIGFQRKLVGCPPETLRRVRDPLALPTLPAAEGLRYCQTRTRASLGQRLARLVFGVWGGRKYLLKPRASHLGRGIEWWSAGRRIGRGHYLQQYIRGTPYTAVYFADGWSARLLGVTETLVGEPAFGARGFAVVGHLGPVRLGERARGALSHLGVQLTQRFDMRGLFGVDLVMDHRGLLWPVEVNPRYVEAVEVLERATQVALLASTGPAPLPTVSRTFGRATVWAERDLVWPGEVAALAGDAVADVPAAGATVAAGEAVATVFAAGASREACERGLRERAGVVRGVVAGEPTD